jgi:PmbA protein
MIERLISILNQYSKISGWKIDYHNIESKEVFFVRHVLDLDRGKNVEKCLLTIYRDVNVGNDTFRGSCDVNIYPTMVDDEIKKAIDEAYYAAGFVKNKYFPLVEKGDYKKVEAVSNIATYKVEDLLNEIIDAVLEADHYKDGYVNSFEVFINKDASRLITSTGVDYEATNYAVKMELITTYQGKNEEIELFDYFNFAEFNKAELTKKVEEQLEISRDRSIAIPTPNLGKLNIIVKDESVKDILGFFDVQVNANSVYQKMSRFKIDDFMQSKDAKGDKITLTKVPLLASSIHSLPFDSDGVILKPELVIKESQVVKYHGSSRVAYYLGVEPTGVIVNNQFAPGSQSISELKKEPYLEVISFSDLQVNEVVGNFGGEIRLAYYFDGNKITPVYGGSISGNLFEVIDDIYLSRETISINEYEGPKYLKVKMTVAGNQ